MGRKWGLLPSVDASDVSKFGRAARRAVATFVFATAGLLIGSNVLDMDVAAWELVASAGLGALLNLAYRWAEGVLKEPAPVDAAGGPIEISKPQEG